MAAAGCLRGLWAPLPPPLCCPGRLSLLWVHVCSHQFWDEMVYWLNSSRFFGLVTAWCSPPVWTGWIIDTMVCWNHPPFLSNSFLASQQSLSLFYAFGHRYHRWAPLSLSAYVLSPLLSGRAYYALPAYLTLPCPQLFCRTIELNMCLMINSTHNNFGGWDKRWIIFF